MNRVATCLVALGVLLGGSTGRAQPADEPEVVEEDPVVREARLHFERGRELATMRRFGEASEAFERSLAAVPRASPPFNLALCYYALAHYAEAPRSRERFTAEASPT